MFFGDNRALIFCLSVQKLVDSLYSGPNIPTILQSLGCIAQHSISTIEPWQREIAVFINERIFRVTDLNLLVIFAYLLTLSF